MIALLALMLSGHTVATETPLVDPVGMFRTSCMGAQFTVPNNFKRVTADSVAPGAKAIIDSPSNETPLTKMVPTEIYAAGSTAYLVFSHRDSGSEGTVPTCAFVWLGEDRVTSFAPPPGVGIAYIPENGWSLLRADKFRSPPPAVSRGVSN